MKKSTLENIWSSLTYYPSFVPFCFRLGSQNQTHDRSPRSFSRKYSDEEEEDDDDDEEEEEKKHYKNRQTSTANKRKMS